MPFQTSRASSKPGSRGCSSTPRNSRANSCTAGAASVCSGMGSPPNQWARSKLHPPPGPGVCQAIFMASALPEKLRCLVGVAEDLQALHLVALPAPDVDHRRLRRLATLRHVRVPEDDHGVALLVELVGRQLEAVPGTDGLLQRLDRRVLAVVLA